MYHFLGILHELQPEYIKGDHQNIMIKGHELYVYIEFIPL